MQLVRAAAARQRSHGDAILLCVGQPSTPAPRAVLDAVHGAIDTQVLGYTESDGIPALRVAIAEHYQAAYGVPVTAQDVLATNGSSGGFSTLLLAAFEPGARIAMTRPGYPAYRNTVQGLGCVPVDLVCGPETRFQPTVELLEELPQRPDGVIIASPANPTGTIIDARELERIAHWCEANDVLLISDEIYHGISYGRECASAWEFSRAGAVMGSISKYHSMTGWRLGWALLPPELRTSVDRLQGNLAICAPAVSQVGAVAAFSSGAQRELRSHVERYARNRDVLLRRLPELGITSFAPPDGAFYAYCDIGHLTTDSLTWCHDVLARTGVALAPGIDFDPIDGHHYMRLSFCGDTADLNEALDRLAAVC
ncbi:aminotransferase class I/II-fold pyridoxal phosphate-dependent enzyme [Allobranchiibius sp. GilTou38]|uniref:pyridoxal phosphate-dependent aminotransferase n=1 Tax=Allobranchiibius sp. GilTou38 TaxID=2815210 RepID=UPI001AA10E99|nr:aminotransferase class I/II-fold pyridoxal phosphate-dependent enzyme [Allobranchiibius sp. GilTou38]MBO1766214.1 aminotransferase class I/II-fold pyridoxal phosphate-dependent enzyme [Allobranchiibius sp. GilTou38]